MAITHKSATSLKKGDFVLMDGIACRVSNVQTSRPGKHGHAKVRIEGIGLIDEKKRQMLAPGHEVEVPIIEKKNAQVLAVSGTKAQVMDMETYETFDLQIPGELKGEVHDGCTVLYWDILGERVIKQVVKKAE